MPGKNPGKRRPKVRRGQMVQVRSADEILATLDAEGKLEGLPFQPEMLKYCGGTFPVYRRAEKIFLDHHYYVARMENTVFLEGLRCDGAAHGGCQMGCLLFWKEAWLKPADPARKVEPSRGDAGSGAEDRLPVVCGDRYCCQASEQVGASTPLAWWDVRQYLHDITSGELTLRELARMLGLLVCQKFHRLRGHPPQVEIAGQGKKTPAVSLNLQPGELVEVKTREEIRATLDARGKNRGLGFGEALAAFCGGRYRVAGRADRIILEWSGEMCKLTNTVVLETVTCDGLDKRGCPRDCYHLWREIWLKRVSQPAAADPPACPVVDTVFDAPLAPQCPSAPG